MKAVICEVVDETKEIKTFRLATDGKMTFVAGQWMYVKLSPELKHHFTISSSPTEPKVQFTTKFREESEFKQTLWKYQVGQEVEVSGPFGSFVLDVADTRPRLFVAGGIGITPFRSQMRYVVDKKLSLQVTLLYSSKTKTDMAFIQELEGMQSHSIKVVALETSTMGRVNAEMIRKECPDWQNCTVWVCGPPAMVEASWEMAKEMGWTEDAIKAEEFTGY